MPLSTLLLFVPACLALNLAPGPNNLLSVSNAARYGFRSACLAGAGRLAAFTGMIALTAVGLAAALQASELLFQAIKWLGACYLLYLAVRLWRAPPRQAVSVEGAARPLAGLARQEFLVAAGNPKAILIFTAFLPQFLDPHAGATQQFVVLGALFLALEALAIAAYACMGVHLQRLMGRPQAQRLFNRCCAGLLGIAGAGLLLSRRAAT